jgi:hypothetical protein
MRNELKGSKQKEPGSSFEKVENRSISIYGVREQEAVSVQQASEKEEIKRQLQSHSHKPRPGRQEAHRS